MLHFYKSAVKNLQYSKTFSLYKHAATLSRDAVVYSQYADFSLDASYANTKATLLPNSFNTSDITLSDTFDIFNKKAYLVDAIASDVKVNKFLLQHKKEQLFSTLVTMVALYHTQKQKLQRNQKLYNEQKMLYDKLFILQTHGAISKLDLLRFKNTLTQLQTKIVQQKNEIVKMQKQLHLYAPKQAIPDLDRSVKTSKKQFLLQNPQLQANKALTERIVSQSKALQYNYLPDLSAGVGYQKLGDPTSYGDNYSFTLALHIPLNKADQKEAEALRTKALSQESHSSDLKIQRENKYIALLQNYKSNQQQLEILRANLHDYQESQKIVKAAFLKHYVDFNTYLQVLTQNLHIQEQIITLEQQKARSATLLNGIGSGAIYE